MTTSSNRDTKLYDQDFVAWVDEQALLIKQERWHELDLVNLVEEIEDIGKSPRLALTSNLRVLLQHLLKYKYQAEKLSGSWRATIREHRKRCQRILKDSPSLKPYLAAIFDETYQDARELAADETELE